MSLSNQIAAIEAEIDAVKAERDMLRRQVNRQEGAITEGRAEREQLRKELRRWQTKVERYETYFRNLHRGLTDLRAQNKTAAEQIEKAITDDDKVTSLTERLKKISA